ncbi:MAG: 2,3-diphosphoglycerate-dependent phosphoglycerate mutase [Acidimicrobiales bacterium]
MPTLVLLRHGQSQWNLDNRFTGWWDVDLSPTGEKEARSAGTLLAGRNIGVDVAHTSVLLRAIRTLQLALDEMGRLWVPVRQHWRLNERHYGALTGLDKAQTKERYGERQFAEWRRGYNVAPPVMEKGHPFDVASDPRYSGLAPEILPRTECLADVIERVIPYWQDAIAADLLAGKVVLVSSHGNTLRGMVKHLEGLTDEEVARVEIPTGVPLVYTLADSLAVIHKEELAQP